MASGPSVSSETRERQREVRNALTKDIEEVLEDFVNRLDNVAAKHGWCVHLFNSCHQTDSCVMQLRSIRAITRRHWGCQEGYKGCPNSLCGILWEEA
jgi:hypothetical protein